MSLSALIENVGDWLQRATQSDLMGPIVTALVGALVAQYFAHRLSLKRERTRAEDELRRARRSDVLAALDRSMTSATLVFQLMELTARQAMKGRNITSEHADLRSRLMELSAANMVLRARLGGSDPTYRAFRQCSIAGNEFDAKLHSYAAGLEPLSRALGKVKAGRWFEEAGPSFNAAFEAAMDFVDREFDTPRDPDAGVAAELGA